MGVEGPRDDKWCQSLFVGFYLLLTFADGSFLDSVFNFENSCTNHMNIEGRCTITLVCWLVGGTPAEIVNNGCGDENSYWRLVTCCCVPSSLNIDPLTRRRDVSRKRDSTYCGQIALLGKDENIDQQFERRVIGGNAVFSDVEIPWQAYIKTQKFDEGTSDTFHCGGVLVSNFHIVTAAHCVDGVLSKNVKVFLGLTNLHEIRALQYSRSASLLGQTHLYHVANIFFHPDYSPQFQQPDRYDIAILELTNYVQYSINIKPLCLPKNTDSFIGKLGLVAGWGATNPHNKSQRAKVLQKAILPILDAEKCRMWYQSTGIDIDLYDEIVCAGYYDGGIDSCRGDSGSALVVYYQNRYSLAGITSSGFGCATKGRPGIYHYVPRSTNWIKSVIHSD